MRRKPTDLWVPDYKAMVESAGDGIFAMDLMGHYTYANRAAMKNIGYGMDRYDEVIGMKFDEVMTPASKAAARDHYERAVAGEVTTPILEVQVVHPDGKIVDLEVRLSGLYHDGKLVGRQGLGRNITEIKKLQNQVSETSERLALLEEKERITTTLYNRFATLTNTSSTTDDMRALEFALVSVTAERFGLVGDDVELLKMLAQGLTNREIAEAIHLSPHTIKDRVGRILKSMNASSRAEAVAIAIRNGLITNDT